MVLSTKVAAADENMPFAAEAVVKAISDLGAALLAGVGVERGDAKMRFLLRRRWES